MRSGKIIAISFLACFAFSAIANNQIPPFYEDPKVVF